MAAHTGNWWRSAPPPPATAPAARHLSARGGRPRRSAGSRPPYQRLFKQAAASPLMTEPPHGLARVRIFDRHFRAVQRRVAPGTQLHPRFAGQLRDSDGFHLAHPAAAAGERPQFFIPKMPASTSLTPPSAASRLVCIQMAEIPFCTSWNGRSAGLFFQRVEDDRVVGDDELAAVRPPPAFRP